MDIETLAMNPGIRVEYQNIAVRCQEDAFGRTRLLSFEVLAHLRVRCTVVDFEHEIADGIEVEAVILQGKFDPPTADSTAELEWEVSLVIEVEFEDTAVVNSFLRWQLLQSQSGG